MVYEFCKLEYYHILKLVKTLDRRVQNNKEIRESYYCKIKQQKIINQLFP